MLRRYHDKFGAVIGVKIEKSLLEMREHPGGRLQGEPNLLRSL
jgi:hypothetical protein